MFSKEKIKFFICVLSLIFFLNGVTVLADEIDNSKSIDGIKATVTDIITTNEKNISKAENEGGIKEQQVKVLINTGNHKGESIIILNSVDTSMSNDFLLHKGDEILISIEETDGNIVKAYMYEYARDKYLLYLVLGFVVLMILIGGIKGLKSIFTLGVTVLAILKLLPTLLLRGYDPIKTSVVMSVGIIIFTLLVVSGSNRKTVASIIGTSCGVAIAGVIAKIVGDLTKLSGYGTEESQMLMYIPQNIKFDYKGLLFAAILMGALGAIMDISMSIASAMNEIDDANPNISTASLMKAGMSVGHDIMGTMSNTLILAYVGASLQSVILLIAYKVSFIDIINQNIIATEVVRALSGSIGLIASIPITVLASGMLRKREIEKSLDI
ncbi:YibE/F family protein [Clostridium ganghwense]|uniref:YibE/F family protein n=1 Tax=Clostridium ganghwense TaxID=312089 RepID=A0ABT4CNX4_9CLOT|nr:YibE/F family protein [Clostridium ganghwense]MCY6370765.1 YibE/F family protein [Clostridium ganghwense]